MAGQQTLQRSERSEQRAQLQALALQVR